MQIDVNNFFYSSSGSGDIREKHIFQNQLDVYFCYSLYIKAALDLPKTVYAFVVERNLLWLNDFLSSSLDAYDYLQSAPRLGHLSTEFQIL